MNEAQYNRCHVRLIGRNCEHDLCYLVRRGVPPELRCTPDQPAGYGTGGRGCCTLPPDIDERVERELRFNFQEAKRRGYVLVAA
ncbi:hypothetical protein ACFVJS_00980 [Nocardioides sp. NPDC057772]|uniref:hypothetical protein n=1 Tax=Nocardioides sp. NPDC057772 TaxID=3346245 RepID=UPI00366F7CAC